MIEYLKKIKQKLLISKYYSYKCIFTKNEIEIIKDITIKLIPITEEDTLSIEIFHLLCGTNNNLEEDFISYCKNVLSLPHKYYLDESIQNVKLYNLLEINVLNQKLMKIDGKILSPEQERIYELFDKMNIYLKSGTGTGKTFISTNFLIKKFKEKMMNEKNTKFIYIVPTEILESQIINNLHERNEDIKKYIGNNIIEKRIFIGTWEKLSQVINGKEILIEIDTLIIDEAHCIFEENDRSKYLYFLLEIYLKNKSINRIILLSPFEIEDKYKFQELFYKIDFLYIDYKKNLLTNRWLINKNEMSENYSNEKDFDNFIYKNSNLIICVLTSSKSKAKEFAEKFYNSNHKINIEKYIEENLDKTTKEKLINEINKNDWKLFNKYKNFLYIKSGICYLTSDIPDSIKILIINLVSNGYIRLIFSTSLIISGIDLPIDVAMISDIKINKKFISYSEVINFLGRSGRIGHDKKAYASGYGFIKRNKKNFTWWKNNKKLIEEGLEKEIKHNKLNSVDENKINFINQSYKKWKETNDERYIYEPRINPILTEKLINLKINEFDYQYLISNLIYWTNENQFSTNNFDQFFLFIINFYQISDYQINIHKKENKSPIKKEINCFFNNNNLSFQKQFINFINNPKFYDWQNYNPFYKDLKTCIKFYIKYNFSIEKSIRTYVGFLNNKLDNFLSSNYSDTIEKFVDNIKTIGKYLLLMFINHFYLISNTKKFTNIITISTYFVTNQEFYNFLSDNNFFEKYLEQITNNKNALKKWKQINIFRNSIYDIYKELRQIKNNMKIYDILELNSKNSILTKLEEYLKDK